MYEYRVKYGFKLTFCALLLSYVSIYPIAQLYVDDTFAKIVKFMKNNKYSKHLLYYYLFECVRRSFYYEYSLKWCHVPISLSKSKYFRHMNKV